MPRLRNKIHASIWDDDGKFETSLCTSRGKTFTLLLTGDNVKVDCKHCLKQISLEQKRESLGKFVKLVKVNL